MSGMGISEILAGISALLLFVAVLMNEDRDEKKNIVLTEFTSHIIPAGFCDEDEAKHGS